MEQIVASLVDGLALPEKNKDHALTGYWVGHRECHILPDWLLVYRVEDDFLILQYRFSKGIYSHEIALFLHAMTDRTPSGYTMTFPKSCNSGNVRAKNIKVRYSMPAIFK